MFEKMKIRYFVLSAVVLFFGLATLYGLFIGKPSEMDPVSDVIFQYIMLGIFPLTWFSLQFKKQKQPLSNVVNIKGINPYIKDIVILVPTLLFFTYGAYWLTAFALHGLFPNYVKEFLADELDIPSNKILYMLTVLNGCVVGPIAEEFMFRGLLTKRLGKKTSIILGTILSSIIFGVFHSDILGSFVFGFILSMVFLKTNNLAVTILIHILSNSIVLVMPYTPKFIDIWTISDLYKQMTPNIICLVITTSILLIYALKNWNVFGFYREAQVEKIEKGI